MVDFSLEKIFGVVLGKAELDFCVAKTGFHSGKYRAMNLASSQKGVPNSHSMRRVY